MNADDVEIYNLGVTTMERNNEDKVRVSTPRWVQDARHHNFHRHRNYDLTEKVDLRLLSFSDMTGFSQVNTKRRGESSARGNRGFSNRNNRSKEPRRGRGRGRGRGRDRGRGRGSKTASKDGSVLNRFSALDS